MAYYIHVGAEVLVFYVVLDMLFTLRMVLAFFFVCV
jgi:hypothetical protein